MNKISIAARVAAVVVPALVAVGCGAEYTTADGYEASYVEAPPPALVASPTYRFGGGYIYEGNGHYYHPYNGRWVAYRHLPHDATRIEGRAVYQHR